jgi:hypothetical protein
MRRRETVANDDTGNCSKLDAACAERVSHSLKRCAEQHAEAYKRAKKHCDESYDPERCHETTDESFRESILDCVEER